jgi:hypothetical protein
LKLNVLSDYGEALKQKDPTGKERSRDTMFFSLNMVDLSKDARLSQTKIILYIFSRPFAGGVPNKKEPL